ncbi:hypothetical protein BDN70DRAFT_882664 [Pholiota conissans]|uniref:Antibiotic biosynthesis monooxygenase n=1 Tax=Pholiota conissans TaxID=109636 RepID=A0A9P5YV24_9AGAR|nr:hypothetical protein BDN70DRAFT_882664 [Pholiota conissans]
MTAPEVKFGILAPVVAKPGQEAALAEFLNVGYDLSLNEPDTVQWFAIKYTDGGAAAPGAPTTFAIFDTFVTPAGRAAHLGGPIAAALMANAPVLLDGAPQIGEVEILASIVRPTGAGRTVGLSVGQRVLFEAKEGKVDTVKEFLASARPLVLDEPGTLGWYAIWYPGTNKFGIVDFFASEQGRDAHLNGKVAEALFGSVGELITSLPEIVKVDVLAAKA